MTGTNILLTHVLPADAVSLGRLVLNIHHPEQDFHQSADPIPTDILTQHLHDFQHTLATSADTVFTAYLTALLSGGRSTQHESKISLATATCTTRQLLNSSAYLTQLCETRPARFWLERAIRRSQDVFLVTGTKTVVDASVEDEVSRGGEWRGKAVAPMGMAAAGMGVPVAVDGGVPDVGLEANRARTVAESKSFTAPGEQVFAVQYRKLRFGRFARKKDVDDARPEEGSRWEMYLGGRGEGAEEEEGEQVVSVEVGDEVQEADLGRVSYGDVDMGGEKFVYPTV